MHRASAPAGGAPGARGRWRGLVPEGDYDPSKGIYSTGWSCRAAGAAAARHYTWGGSLHHSGTELPQKMPKMTRIGGVVEVELKDGRLSCRGPPHVNTKETFFPDSDGLFDR